METQARLAVRLDRAGDDEVTELVGVLTGAGASGVTRPRMGDPIPGTRGMEDEVADVVATITPAVGLLERVLTAVRSWLARRPRRTLKMTIGGATVELTGYSSAAEDQLVRAFVEHVCTRD